MKTRTQIACLLLILATLGNRTMAQRFHSEVFTGHTVTSNVVYAQNYTYLVDPQNPSLVPLEMDVYEPAGDSWYSRPLIIMLHTGSYLPACFNGLPTGNRNDSAMVEVCRQFARRGFVVASISYRVGWSPGSSQIDVRKGTLFRAVYRSIQDAKCAIRFFRKDFATSNQFRVDTSAIILGGMGTGGYIVLNGISLDKPSEWSMFKFISGIDEPFFGFVSGEPFINDTLMGDLNGFGGHPSLNYGSNHTGYSSDFLFGFNLGGALGDSTWIEPGDKPTVSFHIVGDPFAPYLDGMVYVPGNPPMAVVDVAGSGLVSQFANQYGNNSCYSGMSLTDPYTLAANQHNSGNEGLFPFITDPMIQSGVWEWWDQTASVNYCNSFGLDGNAINQNGLAANGTMSQQKALTYIDTVMNYLIPRMVNCFPIGVGLADVREDFAVVSPNPASRYVKITCKDPVGGMQRIRVYDITSKLVREFYPGGLNAFEADISGLPAGLYVVMVENDRMEVANLKLAVQ